MPQRDDNELGLDKDTDLGPKDNTDDSTLSDMGLTGTPATSSTPVGQGDEPGSGADDERDRS